MNTPSTIHTEPDKNRDPAEAGRDPQQLTAEGEQGPAYDLYKETETVENAGQRNNRVTGSSVNEHNTEPFNAPSPNAYEAGTATKGSGITNQPLAEELKEQEKVAQPS